MRQSVISKQMEIQQLRQNLKLYTVLKNQASIRIITLFSSVANFLLIFTLRMSCPIFYLMVHTGLFYLSILRAYVYLLCVFWTMSLVYSTLVVGSFGYLSLVNAFFFGKRRYRIWRFGIKLRGITLFLCLGLLCLWSLVPFVFHLLMVQRYLCFVCIKIYCKTYEVSWLASKAFKSYW